MVAVTPSKRTEGHTVTTLTLAGVVINAALLALVAPAPHRAGLR